MYSRVPSGTARCKGHQGWYGLSKAFREGRSPLLDIYRGGPFMASKSQGAKKEEKLYRKKLNPQILNEYLRLDLAY